jgi:hypothetical protein
MATCLGGGSTCYILCYILRLKRGDTASQVTDLYGLANMGSTPAASTNKQKGHPTGGLFVRIVT